jgi:tetratricopeptide (TPR) repeat protein
MNKLLLIGLLLGAGAAHAESARNDEANALSKAGAALVVGDYELALREADAGLVVSHDSAWLHYDRGVALVGVGRTDDGLAELRDAERLFPGDHEKSLAVYRRIIALREAGRCQQAAKEVAAYLAIVKDPRVARLAKCELPDRQNVSGRD